MSAAIVARSRTTTPEAATNRPTMSFTSGMSWADDDDLLPRVDPTRAGVIPIAIMDPLRQMTLDMSAIDQRSAGAGETACKGGNKRGGGSCTSAPTSPADTDAARSRCCRAPQQDGAEPAPATPACCERVPSSSSALSGGGSASEEAASDVSSTAEPTAVPTTPAQPTSPTGTIKFNFDLTRLRLGPNAGAPGAARPANLNAILPVSEMRRPVENSRLFNLVPLDMRGGEAATAIAPAPNTEATTPPPTTYGHRARAYAVKPMSMEELPRALARRLQGAPAEEEEATTTTTTTTTTTNTPDAESDLELETPLLGNGADTEYDLKYYSSVF